SLQSSPGFDLVIGLWLFMKILFVLLDIALVAAFIYAFYQGWKLRPHLEIHDHGHKEHGHDKPAPPVLQKELVQKRWTELTRKTEGGSLDALRIGIIEADALVD